jgi:glucose-1-phosphate thymidylyltransferase
MTYFEDGKKFNANIIYVVQDKPLGTGHAVKLVEPYIDSDFIVLPGDNIVDSQVVADVLKSRPPSILITESRIPSKYGVVLLSGKVVKRIIEKPEQKISNLISTGIHYFTTNIFEYISLPTTYEEYYLTSVVQSMMRKEKVYGVFTSGNWVDAVYPWDLLNVNAVGLLTIKLGVSGRIEKNVTLRGNIHIGENSKIRSGCYLIGPLIIGKNCEIGPNVCITPSTSIGDNVEIEAYSVIKNSLIMNDVSIGATSYIANTVIGDGVKIGTHFVSVNEKVSVVMENEIHNVDVGSLIGEDTTIRNCVTINPGCVIGAHCKIGSMCRITTHLQNNSIVM